MAGLDFAAKCGFDTPSPPSLINASNRREIAQRLRDLLAGRGGGDVAAIAHRLGVDEASLRMSIDETSPFPKVDVLAAVVREYGVDPAYLLTGEYDAGTHRAALKSPEAAAQAIQKMVSERSTPSVATPTPKPSRRG